MILQLDLQSETPIYLQIKHQIIEGIASNNLTSGEGLPSVRALASDLGINMHTVNKAYRLLKQDGYIVIHRQKGVFVNPEIPGADRDFLERLESEMRPLAAEAASRGMTQDEWRALCHQMMNRIKG